MTQRRSDLVLDACVALAWAFREEEHDEAVQAALHDLQGRDLHAPGLWTVEVLGGLLVGERRGRLRPDESDLFLALLTGLDVRLDHRSTSLAFGPLKELARRHELRSKDACYLELALRRRALLATVDRRLDEAAASVGLSYFRRAG